MLGPYTPVCLHCRKDEKQHAGTRKQCLFAPTYFVPLTLENFEPVLLEIRKKRVELLRYLPAIPRYTVNDDPGWRTAPQEWQGSVKMCEACMTNIVRREAS